MIRQFADVVLHRVSVLHGLCLPQSCGRRGEVQLIHEANTRIWELRFLWLLDPGSVCRHDISDRIPNALYIHSPAGSTYGERVFCAFFMSRAIRRQSV